jgi:murein DD-endopeptidase MepM/ murein hydrolase activator NlpD
MVKLRQLDRRLKSLGEGEDFNVVPAAIGVGGSEGQSGRERRDLKADADQLIRRMHKDLDRLLAEAGLREQRQHQLGKLYEDSKSIMASTPDDWPLNGPLTSYFGYRKSPFGSRSEFHRGLDISAPSGTAINAPAEGIVVSTEWNSGYGLILTVNHGYGIVTRYAHLSQCYVEQGQRISRGERIAAVGASGRVTGPHLHYEVILNGIPVNPMRYLAKAD